MSTNDSDIAEHVFRLGDTFLLYSGTTVVVDYNDKTRIGVTTSNGHQHRFSYLFMLRAWLRDRDAVLVKRGEGDYALLARDDNRSVSTEIYNKLKIFKHKIEKRLNPENLNSFSSIIHVTFADLELVKQAAELINSSGEYRTPKLSTDEELVVKFRSEIKQLVETIKAKIATDRDKLEKLGHAPEHTQIDWDYKSPALTGRMDALEEVLDLLEVFVVL